MKVRNNNLPHGQRLTSVYTAHSNMPGGQTIVLNVKTIFLHGNKNVIGVDDVAYHCNCMFRLFQLGVAHIYLQLLQVKSFQSRQGSRCCAPEIRGSNPVIC